jgi:branched-chain amino acid transport system substrate-binding protein
VVSEAEDVGDDRTIWLGAMFPLSGPDADAYGRREFHAVDLARREVARMLSGTNNAADAASAHPIALVACDDAVDPRRAARHLTDDVGAPAVIGFRSSQEAIDLATSTFLPHGTLVLSALNTSPLVTRVPRPAGLPRLVWRTALSATQTAAASAALVAGVLEPAARRGPLGSRDPMRVALVRQDDPAGQGFADAFFGALKFNGRSAVENGADFDEILFPFAAAGAPGAAGVTAAQKALAFAPHVIVYFGADETFARILEPLERAWPARTPRPVYLKPAVLGEAVVAFVGRDADRRRRFFGMTSASSSITNVRFVSRFDVAYDEHVTRTFSPNSSYDSFYLLAYATYAAPDGGATGTGISRGLLRLLPPGAPVDVGPEGIFSALEALSAGRNVDLQGATGKLDFDVATGDAPVDLTMLCLGVDGHGMATDGIESGVVFDAASGTLSGTPACP